MPRRRNSSPIPIDDTAVVTVAAEATNRRAIG